MILSTYLCAAKQFPPYLHNGMQYRVMTSYATTRGKNQQDFPDFSPLDSYSYSLYGAFTQVTILGFAATSDLCLKAQLGCMMC